ncbi:hypothetical protein C0995_015158 [Termitomyces sp. Mi166|nr:hypothetical protein C0995_015158 [Termitomyces sp. Mi166\
MPPKSIFRRPGAKHFQLVHRSQRDPLIHDPDASQHVLKPLERENRKKGKSRADLESILPASEIASDRLANVGEAALYGIYYDDTEYNYMQHLRAVGVQEDGVESVLIEAPSSSKSKAAKKAKGIEMRDLPEGVLASKSALPRRTYESQQAIPESIAGFQPDMDPHLRQVLEALDDDAFVKDDLEDDFFAELVADGERGSDEEVDYEFEDGYQAPSGSTHDEGEELPWEERFARFKQSRHKQAGSDDGYDGSEGGDTVGTLPAISVIGGKKRRKGTSDASGYSMSSSSMYRNEALQTLDERFDQIMIKQYADDDGDDKNVYSEEEDGSDEAPELITSRGDFESMMDEFLNDYEILGRKMKPKLDGDTGTEKLDTIRRALGQDDRVRLDKEESGEEDDILMPLNIDDKQDRWDCETILTTYSNLENHPRLIRARDSKTVAKITLDPRTGFPTIADPQQKPQLKRVASGRTNYPESDSDDDSPVRQTITRSRDESKEDKKARKAAVKAERQARRKEKKATSEVFVSELKLQKRTIANKEERFKKL